MARKRIIEKVEDDDDDEVDEEYSEQWDPKRIVVGLVVVMILGFGVYFLFKQISGPIQETAQVLSASTQAPPNIKPEDVPLPKVSDLNSIVSNLTKQVSHLTIQQMPHLAIPQIPQLHTDHLISSQSAVLNPLKKYKLGNKSAAEIICDIVCK